MKRENPSDIAKEEDLLFAIMNLISVEEHLAFTAMKTNKNIYLEVLDVVRDLRKKLLKKFIVNTEGEMWCISKHLLAITMRLMETGAKYLKENGKEANEFYRDAFDVYTLFWFLQKVGGKNDDGKTGKKTGKAKK